MPGEISKDIAQRQPGKEPPDTDSLLVNGWYRSDFTDKPHGIGTGLGLSLCRGIVEGHGGTMSVKS